MPHIHEKIDFTVETFIVHKNKVLLRMHDKYYIWLSIGGHIELDEDPVQAVVREAREEVGLNIKIAGSSPTLPDDKSGYQCLIAPRYLGSHNVNETHKHIVFVYFAVSDSDAISQSSMEHERMETRWVTREELEDMNLRPNVLFYATEALKELGEK